MLFTEAFAYGTLSLLAQYNMMQNASVHSNANSLVRDTQKHS